MKIYLWNTIIRLLMIIGFLLIASPTQASGILMYETGTPGVGLGSAGYAAGAQDASTLYYNPAGMMRLGKSEYLVGAQAMVGYMNFQPAAGVSAANSGENPLGWLPGGSFYYVNSINSNTKVGFGTFSNFGTVMKYQHDSAARYSLLEGAMVGITFMPAIAHRINDQWSVGGAINATSGILRNKTSISNELRGTDGSMELNDNKWGFGANIGLLYEPDKQTRWGLTYNSPVALNFSATPSYSNIGTGVEDVLRRSGLFDRNVDQSVTIPQQVMLGFAREVNSRWTLMGDVGWQNWSNFGYKQVTIAPDAAGNPVNLSRELHGQDTWHAALGAKYKASPKWTLSFGVGYDTSAFNEENRPSLMPLGASWRVGVGASTALNPTSTLNLGYEALFTGNLELKQQGIVSGSYAQGILHFFTVNYQRKF